MVTENKNVKIVFAHVFVKSGPIYVKPSPKSWVSQNTGPAAPATNTAISYTE